MKKKLLILLLAFVMAFSVFALVACGDDNEPGGDSTTLTLSTATLSVEEGESKQITVTYNGTGTLTYTVNMTDVATVAKDASDQKKATVTGVKAGTATLTVTDGTLTKTCAITVTEKEAPAVSLTLSKTTVTLEEGGSEEITATYNGEGTLTYTVDKTDVATVTKDSTDQKKATITAVGEGTATLTVTDGTVSKTLAITITPKPETVTIMDGENEADEAISLEREVTKQLTAETTNGSTVTWVSTNETVATVNSEGLVSAIRPGTTIIRASANSAAKDEVTLTVTRKDIDPYYDLKASDGTWSWNGSGFNNPAPDENEFYYWANFRSGWVQGGVVNVKEAYYEYNTLVIDYSGVEVANAVQIHRKKSESVTVGGYYVLTAKIYTDTAGCVTINGNVFELNKGDNSIEMYMHPEKEDTQVFDMTVGGNGSVMSKARLEIYDIVWAEDQERVQLATPSFTIDEDGVIAITDEENDADAVAEYRLGFFQDGEEVASTVVTDGEAIDVSVVDSGDYTVEIKAIGVNCHYIDSAYSETNTAFTVENEAGRSYDLKVGEEEAISNLGEWTFEKTEHIYQTEWVDRFTFSGKFENGTANLYFKNNEAAQVLNMYYQPQDVTANKVYKVELEITVDADELINITSHGNNGTEFNDVVNGATTAWITICGTPVELTVGEAKTYTVYTKAVDEKALVHIAWHQNTDENYNRISRATVHVANPTIEEIEPETIATPTFTWDGETKTIDITDETNEDGTVGKYVVGFFSATDTDTPSFTIDAATTGETVLDLSVIGEGEYTIKVKAVAATVAYIDSAYVANSPADTVSISAAKLATPTFVFDAEAMTITVSDDTNDSDVVARYVVGLFNDSDEPIATFNVYTKDVAAYVHFNGAASGDYKIKVKAAGIGAAYPDSDWTNGEDITVTAATDMTRGGENDGGPDNKGAVQDPDKWYLFSNTTIVEGVSTNGDDLDTVIIIEYTGGNNWWSVQLFREISANTNGKQYTLSFDLTVEFTDSTISEAKIKVNGNDQIVIKAGETNHISQTWTESGGASISIQFGTASPEKPLPGRYIISNIQVVEVA